MKEHDFLHLKDTISEEFQFDDLVDENYKLNEEKSMSNIFKLNLKDIVGAIVSTVLVAILSYLVSLTKVVDINGSHILDITVFTAAASLLKALLTNNAGNFAGIFKVK